MINILQRRHILKQGREILRHAKHVRNMREDVFTPEMQARMGQGIAGLQQALAAKDTERIETASERLCRVIDEATPLRRFGWLREHLEVGVVAIAVAMALRAYFVQPFKIPTGSMQPTLYGIHVTNHHAPSWMDQPPLKVVKWLVTGKWYRRIVVKEGGRLSGPKSAGFHNPSMVYVFVGGTRYKLPGEARLKYFPGDYIPAGSVLWEGTVRAGDHVFVNKMSWNFGSPKRGNIIVFSTDGITGLPPDTHYIKRLIGLPGERVSIAEPYVCIDGKPYKEHGTISKIANMAPPYETPYLYAGLLSGPHDALQLENDQYFAMGDNTDNSRDSRYWGAVPQPNMVGPASMVYWPFSERWGLTGL